MSWSRCVQKMLGLLVLLASGCQSDLSTSNKSASQDLVLEDGVLAQVQPPYLQKPAATSYLEDGCGHRLVIESDPFRLRIERTDGVVVSSLASGGLRIGAVGTRDPDYNYDPFYFYSYERLFRRASSGPKGLQWLAAAAVSASSQSANSIDMALLLSNGARADVRIQAACPSRFTLDVSASTLGVGYIGFDLDAPEGERYYGLGEYFDAMEQRGQLRAMQLELAHENEDFYNQAHVPVPFMSSTAGWGVFVQEDHPGIFDVAKTDPTKVRIEYGAPSLRIHWMAAARPTDLVKTWHGVSGLPAIPPVWAFAPIHWRDEVSGQQMVLDDINAIRANRIPGSGMWLDRPYESFISSMDLDPTKYPDPEAMVSELHAKGFHMAGWNVPYMDYNDPDYEYARSRGWFVGGYTTQQKWGPLMDLTHPDAMQFWQDRVRAAHAIGFEGWKMDYGEDVLNGAGATAFEFSFYNGEAGDTMHHRYSDYYHRAYFEPYAPADVFILSRNATHGGQKYTSVIWPGDLCNNFAQYGEDQHVGGLPAAVIAGATLGASGFPFFASDTGGYQHGRPTSEVLQRWAAYSAWIPIMQYGGCGDINPSCNPWDFSDQGSTTFTQETLDTFRSFADLHIQLFPFFYRLAERARAEGAASNVPFGFYFPQDGRHPNDQFVVGDALLVAPIVTGGTSRSVRLPAGRMVDFWTGAATTGPSTVTVDVPLNRTPVWFLDGAIVPMLRPGVQALTEVTSPGIDSYATDAGRLWGYVVPSSSQVTRQGLPFEGGELVASASSTGAATLSYAPGAVTSRHSGVNLRIYAPNATRVTLNGSAISQVASGATATCTACFARDSGSPWVWLGVAGMNAFTANLQ